MALFGFNKQKVLATAEKYVQQGKLPNAITEYEKVLKNDPKDLTVTNTVGDLYSRSGESDKATECFKTVGDAYASQGFTVKAIAMYKKICKLQPSLESLLKLAELYTQQGLFNDARAQYLQVAEEFLKAGELENAVRIFQKILEMDPENSTMRIRLAEVYIRLGKKTEAWQIFSAAAESLRSRGSLAAADEVLQRMLTLDPGNAYALLMQGKNLIESGDAAGAVATLSKVPDIDSNPDGLRDLLKAYLQSGQLSDAGAVANKLLTVHNDLQAIASFADALMQAGQYENALQVFDQHAERLLAENSDKVLDSLHTIIGHVRDNPDSLQKLARPVPQSRRDHARRRSHRTAGPRQRAVRRPAPGPRSLPEARHHRAAKPPAHAELPAGGQSDRRRLRRQAHHSGRSSRPHRRPRSHRALGSSALFRRNCARHPLRAHRRRALHLLQHAREGAGPAGRRIADGAQRSSPEPASRRAAHPRRPLRRSWQCAAAPCRASIPTRIIRKKPRATANWPSATRNVPRLRPPASMLKKHPFIWTLPSLTLRPKRFRRKLRKFRAGVFRRRSPRRRRCRSPKRTGASEAASPWPTSAEASEEVTVESADNEFAVVDESTEADCCDFRNRSLLRVGRQHLRRGR